MQLGCSRPYQLLILEEYGRYIDDDDRIHIESFDCIWHG